MHDSDIYLSLMESEKKIYIYIRMLRARKAQYDDVP